VIVATQGLHLGNKRGGGRQHLVAAAIEPAQVRVEHRDRPFEAVVGKVRFKTRVHAGNDRHAEPLGERLRARPEDIRGGNVDQVGPEAPYVITDLAGKVKREAELGALG
jgi:hypothetical protein